MNRNNIIEKVNEEKIIAIIRGVSEDQIVHVVGALKDGGISLVEITFDHDQPDFIEATTRKIRKVREDFGDQVYVGAGTVLTDEEVVAAANAGADYIISPNVNEAVIRKTVELEKVSIPGALTPTEAEFAHRVGADFVKLFPAGDLGINYIKSLLAPLKHIPILAVGGVTPATIKDYLDLGINGVGIGGGLVNKETAKNPEKLVEVAKEFVKNAR
ncbi:bifunctional 4-hydroxy-2-oxoglutarate aldolase/2-dehydro-3-deoxy-phosphogluconate aldolase [Bacillus sp. REN16]|uniref:bifunctional 4-hydroxy-2-oxoglutarate aldolase/2-dehydro-3-deoxy-phosphogluconate aldolase n=1 Tax=Bacillus sp. REN16 TaxID=2887296 RepID=UPI001E3B4E30|nr:bifunctional 4-hydroxy-2-oxoglutarate aldolase/2-dehydro-3-deoxy-phosphogluconate aldolase [Bacillus sp. REN16]MCC3358984.1 bifunctional 4-hydroxy-2-oxoglutarate aldolase/2-dehydro-3-deoxy-phosphogluconate aldolase [Bacillus sp. REN16]